MKDRQQDPELHALFETQRRDDSTHAPSFAEMMARARAEAARVADPAAHAATDPATDPAASSIASTARRAHWRRYRVGALAAAAIAALIIVPRMRSGDDAFEQAVRAFQSDPALGAWQSPTDGLLNLPGDRLLSSIPTVGTGQQ